MQAVISLTSRFDEQELSHVDSPDALRLNEIGRISMRTSEPLPVDAYATSRRTGAFLVIDPADGAPWRPELSGYHCPSSTGNEREAALPWPAEANVRPGPEMRGSTVIVMACGACTIILAVRVLFDRDWDVVA